MGKKYDTSDFDCGMIKITRQGGFNISETADLVRIQRIRGHVFMVGFYQALMVFIIFCRDGRVFMLFGNMHIPNVVSSLFGCFRV